MSTSIDARFPRKLSFLFKPARFKVARGGRGCVHPDTLIDTPSGQVKIKDFQGGDVYSWEDGKLVIAKATKPTPFTVEQLYQVDFVDGQSIIVTDEHKFLTQRGWVELHSLRVSDSIVSLPRESVASPARTNSGTFPLTFPVDVQHCFQKHAGCQGDCSEYFRQCGQQPQCVEDSAQSFVQQPSGEQQHILHALSDLDDQLSVGIHNFSKSLNPQPILSYSHATAAQSFEVQGSHSGDISFEQPLEILKQSLKFHVKNNLETQVQHISEQDQDCDTWLNQDGSLRTIQDIAPYGYPDNLLSKNPLNTPNSGAFILTKPRLVSKHSRQIYWDLHVNETNNYLSNGIVNHNSGKSWGFARAILLRCADKQTRVLCTREIQKSIQQSVHQLLSDQIEAMGLSSVFEILQTEIRGPHGSCIYFSGLSDITATALKSFEGVDLCWCEEAQAISAKSWKTLIPTIRKEGSEIWVTYNPELESDPTHKMFVTNPPEDCVSVLMNWSDNPYFPDVLKAEREHAEKTMRMEDYRNVWEGECLPAVTGAIYFEEVASAEREGRIRDVPNDIMLKTHAIWDLGWNDAMAIILVQRSASELRIVDYIEDSHRTMADYVMQLKQMPLNWGIHYLPHDGFHKDYKTGKSAQEILEALGCAVEQTPNMGIEEGIKAARMTFGRIYFDKNKASRLVECLKRYRRHINKQTNEAGSALHDEFSHGADAFRYACIVADSLGNSSGSVKPIAYRERRFMA